MWKYGTRSQLVVRFRLLTVTVLGVNIIIWSLAIVVLLIKNLPGYMCRIEEHKGKALNENCGVYAMRVCIHLALPDLLH